MLIYILVTALSLPGAAVMTPAGGGLFGFWTATIAISFASTIGATLACAVSRFILRDWVARHFSGKMAAIGRGIEKEGAFYLFTLRLIPIFPFFVVNLLMGLTKLRLTTYFWVPQLGQLPATMVFINAGYELARINTPEGLTLAGPAALLRPLGALPHLDQKTFGRLPAKIFAQLRGKRLPWLNMIMTSNFWTAGRPGDHTAPGISMHFGNNFRHLLLTYGPGALPEAGKICQW